MPRPYSADLRERVLAASERQEGTQGAIARLAGRRIHSFGQHVREWPKTYALGRSFIELFRASERCEHVDHIVLGVIVQSDLLFCEPDDSRAVPCPVKLGSVTFHHSKTPHMTTANRTDQWRHGRRPEGLLHHLRPLPWRRWCG